MYNLLSIAEISSAMVESLMSMGVWYYIILNAFGVIAIVLKVIEFQLKNRNVILSFALIGALCWVLYFIFYGDFVSAIVCGITVIQYLIFINRGKKKWADSKIWLYSFIVVQIVVGIICFKQWSDIFSILAGVFNALAYFAIEKPKYRLLGFISLFWWVLNSAFKFYPIAFANDFLGCASALIYIFRFDIIPKLKNKSKQD
jgi:hypothetical protein